MRFIYPKIVGVNPVKTGELSHSELAGDWQRCSMGIGGRSTGKKWEINSTRRTSLVPLMYTPM